MTDAKKDQRAKSVPKKPERQPIEIEVVFTGPDEPQKDAASAKPADAAAKQADKKKKDRLTFRW